MLNLISSTLQSHLILQDLVPRSLTMPPYLPDEILLHIFSFLRPSLAPETFCCPREKETATLAHLCRTSKRTQRLAQAHLYHTITEQDAEKRAPFLRTLSQNPHLAEMVRAIDLSRTYVSSQILEEAFETARGRLNLSDKLKTRLSNNFPSDDDDTEIVLILSLLPNLELLELTRYYEPDRMTPQFFRDVAASLASTPEKQSERMRPFSRLQEIRLRHWDTEDSAEIFEFDDTLLQTLHTLRGWAICWEIHPHVTRPPRRQLSLKHIDLRYSLCDAEGLSNMLSRCPDLRTLRFQWGSATVGGESALNFDQMGVALRKYAHNLEELVLDYREDQFYQEGDFTGKIGSLRELSCLKKIALTQNILVGGDGDDFDDDEESPESHRPPPLTLDEVLPSSLETLQLLSSGGDDENLDEQIYALITGGRMKNLRKITVERAAQFSKNIKGSGWTTWNEDGHGWGRGEWGMILAKQENQGEN
ncbi:hypothetical protein F5Y13DRAFT_166283 [Hypoxylon sp. FL1857]|nr:hypothetical protein F5Y13DRAFT_166283 [Hypoxylon sp. FL1857]